MRSYQSVFILFGVVPFLAACDGMTRLGGLGSPSPSPVAVNAPAPSPRLEDDTLAAPIPSATRRPITAPRVASPRVEPTPLPGDEEGPLVAPGASAPDDTLAPGAPSVTPPQRVAVATPATPGVAAPGAPVTPTVTTPRPPAPAPATTSSRVVGGWKVAEQNGTNCRLTLSSAPFVDLSRASTSGCGTGLAKVNAWKLDKGEIVLFETGGAVAARLRGGGSTFNGASVKTGAPVTISR
jgi:hypothetical protein